MPVDSSLNCIVTGEQATVKLAEKFATGACENVIQDNTSRIANNNSFLVNELNILCGKQVHSGAASPVRVPAKEFIKINTYLQICQNT